MNESVQSCSSSELLCEIIKNICRDDKARRELLWLRAMEKGDEDAVEILERSDPGLRDRMSGYEMKLEEKEVRSASARREAFGRFWDECFERHSRPARPLRCDCHDCSGSEEGAQT